MEKLTENLYSTLKELIGLHRRLLETVRLEREALVSADLKAVQETTYAKQALVSRVHQTESRRLSLTRQFAVAVRKSGEDLTLNEVIMHLQGDDLRTADRFRATLSTLTLLIKRIREQNSENQSLVEKSLEHVGRMKKNVLGESLEAASTYGQKGQKVDGGDRSRLITTKG